MQSLQSQMSAERLVHRIVSVARNKLQESNEECLHRYLKLVNRIFQGLAPGLEEVYVETDIILSFLEEIKLKLFWKSWLKAFFLFSHRVTDLSTIEKNIKMLAKFQEVLSFFLPFPFLLSFLSYLLLFFLSFFLP